MIDPRQIQQNREQATLESIRPEASPLMDNQGRQVQPQVQMAEAVPVQSAAPPGPTGMDLGDVQKLLQLALSQEFLSGLQPQIAQAVQQMATTINMTLQKELPPQEKQRILEEMVPKLIDLMEQHPSVQGNVS